MLILIIFSADTDVEYQLLTDDASLSQEITLVILFLRQNTATASKKCNISKQKKDRQPVRPVPPKEGGGGLFLSCEPLYTVVYSSRKVTSRCHGVTAIKIPLGREGFLTHPFLIRGGGGKMGPRKTVTGVARVQLTSEQQSEPENGRV